LENFRLCHQKTNLKWQLGDTEISPTNHAIHLGIIRTETRDYEANIEDRISLARKTMYALMKQQSYVIRTSWAADVGSANQKS
jgi:hypothetical protein